MSHKRHDCPKCGANKWSGPIYRRAGYYDFDLRSAYQPEHLEFRCCGCGWVELDPIDTAPQPKPAQPETKEET